MAAKSDPQVYTLLVQIGRSPDDSLPDGAEGAALVCYCAARAEDEAVRETVQILKLAGLSPLDVTGYGTISEREAEGHDIAPEERELMDRALADDAVIVAEVTPLFPDD